MFSGLNTTVFLVLGGLLVAGWGGTWLWQRSEISSLQGLLSAANKEIVTLKGNERVLMGALEEQNENIRALEEIGRQSRARAEEAQRAALTANNILEATLARVSETPLPEAPVEACLAGDALILETYRVHP